MLFSCSFIVEAKINSNLENYDLGSGWQEKKLDIGGYKPIVKKIIESRDDNYIMLVLYKESSSTISTFDGIGNSTLGHSKIIKYDKNFNKIFEKDFYTLLNSSTADSLAPTVETTLEEIVELKNGAFVAVGYSFGLSRPVISENDNPTYSYDDNLDAIYAVFDSNGNLSYKKAYYNQGLDYALSVGALNDGGYIIKYK